MQLFKITNKAKECVAEVYFLTESNISPDGENQYEYMLSLIRQLPDGLDRAWLQGHQGEVLTREIFKMMFECVKNAEKLKIQKYNAEDLMQKIDSTIYSAVTEIPFAVHKYFVFPKFKKGELSAFCYTAASTFIFIHPDCSISDLCHTLAHEYFHAAVKFYESERQKKKGVQFESRNNQQTMISEGLADRFADEITGMDSSKMYHISERKLKEILLQSKSIFASNTEKDYKYLFAQNKNELYSGKSFKYGIGYYIGYYLAGKITSKYDNGTKSDWKAIVKKPLRVLFDESWNDTFHD